MSLKGKIALLYVGVALVSVGIIALAFWARSGMPSNRIGHQFAIDSGRETAQQWFPIKKDLVAVNQANEPVKLSDLRGKVWIAAEFFAVCPHCAVRNGAELREIYDAFKDNPDFHIACVSVDPAMDTPDKLKDYAQALGADRKNWWFLNGGEPAAVHQYMEQELGFFSVRERTDPLEVEANGRYSHDLSFVLVDREFNVIGKWPLADLRSDEAMKRDPQGYERAKKELYDRVRLELGKKTETSAAK